tara:strand:+ start:924 stop:1697 length:774 start_codon:yes stop_codon:yes gene_type:complete
MSQRIIRAWGLFEQTLVQARKRYSSTLMARVYSSLPFLFEGALDRAAPGSGVQVIKGHDHTENGGRALARNLVFSAGVGWAGQSQSSLAAGMGLYYCTGTGGSYTNFHEYTLNDDPIKNMAYQFAGWVSPGVDSEFDANDGSTVGLECEVVIAVAPSSSDETFNLRWENVSEGADVLLTGGVYSTAQSVSVLVADGETYHAVKFDDLPCIGGSRNKFSLAMDADISSVWLMSVICYESRARSAPESSASNNLRTQTF